MTKNGFIVPAKVPEFRISGIASIEDLRDGNHLFWGYACEGDERIVRLKICLAGPAIYTCMQQTMIHLGYKCCGGQRSRIGMN